LLVKTENTWYWKNVSLQTLLKVIYITKKEKKRRSHEIEKKTTLIK